MSDIDRHAEVELRNVEMNIGFIGAVLTIVSAPEDIPVKQAGKSSLRVRQGRNLTFGRSNLS